MALMKHKAAPDRLRDWEEAFKNPSKAPTLQQLIDSGYCRLPEQPMNPRAIARINRKDWLGAMHLSFPGSDGWSLTSCADAYRERLGTGYYNVPEYLWRDLPASGGKSAPTEFRYHWRTAKYRRSEEPPEVEITSTTPNAITEAITMTGEDSSTRNTSTELMIEATPMKVVVVTFAESSGQEFYYFAPMAAQVGDYAVVWAKHGKDSNQPFSIGKIERDSPDLEGRARSAILGTFNEEFARKVQARMDMLAQVKARLQQKRKQYEERRIYELIAEHDPEARELLDQLKKLES